MSYADVRDLVRQTRAFSRPQYGAAEVVRNKGTHAHDVVTKVDHDIEGFLKERLSVLAPEVAFYGEESGGDKDARSFWLCDPVDGTGLYVRGLPFCTTMLAHIEDGQVVFGAIYDFVNDVLYHAEKGKGAFADASPISVSDRGLRDSYVAYETHQEKPENMQRYTALREQTALVKFMCSGYEYVQVARGALDARVTFDPWGKIYDFAPGALLVAEAGGVIANIGTRTYDYRNLDFIAANRRVFEELTGPDGLYPLAVTSA